VQHSTLEALQRYRALRDKTIRPAVAPCFFVNYRGRPQRHGSTNWSFRQLCRRLGWTQSPIPRLHDLRHTFVVRTLLAWYRTHEPIEAKLWSLSTYLGHQHPSATYWYLSAVPQLLQLAQKRFASAQTRAHGGMFHD
jgi:integrase